MFFDATQEFDQKKAMERLTYLIENRKRFEITVKHPRRSISQNSYLHLILNWFGLEFGYTLEDVKQSIFKRHVNSDIFYEGTKEGVVTIELWRSTADLNTNELTMAIDRFRDFSSKLGCYLPEPSDMVALNELERQLAMKSSQQYS